MSPAQRMMQSLRQELAEVNHLLAHARPASPLYRQLLDRQLCLEDDLYFQENLCEQARHKLESLYH